MNGLRVDSTLLEFPGPIEKSVLDLLSKYWFVSTQSGPFRITDKPHFEALEKEIDSFVVNVPNFRNTGEVLLRPGIFPKFASLLVIDEWTYLLALEGPEVLALRTALKVEKHGWLSGEFFEIVESDTLGFFVYVNGFWEIYIPNNPLHEKLRRQNGFTPVQSEHWQNETGLLIPSG